MGERERLDDEDIDIGEQQDVEVLDLLPEPITEDVMAQEDEDQMRARGLVELQMGGHGHGHGRDDDYSEPLLREDDGELHEEGKKKAAAVVGLHSLRFADDDALLKVARKKDTLKKGEEGIHVTKVQQALAELGHLDSADVSGKLDKKTVDALLAFQKAKGIGESGKVDAETMIALDGAFSNYAVEAGRAKAKAPSVAPTKGTPFPSGGAPKELLEGTHKPTKKERAAFAKAISTEQVAGNSKKLPKFKKEVGGKLYEDALEALVDKLIDGQLKWATEADTARSAGNTYDWGDIDKVAAESKKAVDGIFGKYALGTALTGTGVAPNIKDAWEHKQKEIKADPAVGDEWAMWRVEKLLTGSDAVAKLDKKYGAIQSRKKEKEIVDRVHDRLATARRDDLILIHKAWPAFASGGDVFIQRIQERDSKGNIDKDKSRSYMWEMFQTVIHEYIHTLEHPDHVAYRGGMTQQKGGFTLREGVTDYFTKIAYNTTVKTPALRKAVEGPFHDKGVVHAIPNLTTYDESENAERGAAIVGFDNMAAAFFLGRVDLIGKI